MARLDEAVARGLGGISIACSRYARTVLVLTLLATVVFGYGVSKITTNVDVADVLPRGNYNTVAAHNLTDRFRSTFTQQVTLQLHVDEEGRNWRHDNGLLTFRNPPPSAANGLLAPRTGETRADSRNITDEVYVRATDELVRFVHARTSFSRTISTSNIYNLINWTIAGGDGSGGLPRADESAFALPGYRTREEALRYAQVDAAVKGAVLDTVDAISSPTWDHAAALFMPPADLKVPSRVLGEQMLGVRDEWLQAVREGRTNFTVFGPDNPPVFTVDLPVANAHSSALVREDSLRLLPLIGVLILVFLYIAFRNVRAIAVAFATLVVGLAWSYGTMGYLGIALNTLNMTIVPLVMGIGIDYSIHMINEFVEHKSEGHSDAEAFRIAGQRSGVSMLIATATTVGGLAVLVVSPSLLIAQLGIVAVVALTVIYLLAITFIPAALTLVGGSAKMGASFSPSRIMPVLARGVSRARWVVLALIVVVSVVAYAATDRLGKEAFGDPGRNYLSDDPIRLEHEQGLRDFYGQPDPDEKANILTFEGKDTLTPEAMAYYRELESNLKRQPRVIPDTLRTLPFFIETWLTVKGGPVGAVGNVGTGEVLGLPVPLPDPVGPSIDPFPTTQEGLRQAVDDMFQSPMRELSSIIINHPANDMAAMTFSVRAGTYEEAEEVWGQVWHAVELSNAKFGGKPPGDLKVAFVGNTATNYLFIAEELPWLGYMSTVDNIVLGVLVLLMTRSIKVTFVTLLVSTMTSLWWLALLPSFGIGLAITLTLPFAFIVAIGTDYAIHFMWNIRATGDARKVFASTGKAVLFSAITTTLAFAVFILVQNVAVARTMVATTLAFLVIFAVTMLTIPAFYKVGPARPGGNRFQGSGGRARSTLGAGAGTGVGLSAHRAALAAQAGPARPKDARPPLFRRRGRPPDPRTPPPQA